MDGQEQRNTVAKQQRRKRTLTDTTSNDVRRAIWGAPFQAARIELVKRTGERWSQARIAKIAGVATRTYLQIEHGHPSLTRHIDAIAHAMGYAPKLILERTEAAPVGKYALHLHDQVDHHTDSAAPASGARTTETSLGSRRDAQADSSSPDSHSHPHATLDTNVLVVVAALQRLQRETAKNHRESIEILALARDLQARARREFTDQLAPPEPAVAAAGQAAAPVRRASHSATRLTRTGHVDGDHGHRARRPRKS